MTRKLATIVSITALGTCLMIGTSAQAALQLHYDFNAGSGSTVDNLGDAGDPGDLTMYDSDGTTTVDLHGADGSGVSGLPGDYALNMNALSDVTAAGTGPAAVTTAANANDLSIWGSDGTDGDTFTAQLWYRAETLNGNARVLGDGMDTRWNGSDGGYWQQAGTSPASDGNDYDSAQGDQWGATGQWIFMAWTIDEGNDEFIWYIGDKDTPVAVDIKYDSTTTPAPTSGAIVENKRGQVMVGNRDDYVRVFDGLVDNVRFYDEALSLSELEALRQGDIIPEPASLAMLGLGGLAMLRRRRA